MKDNKLIAEFMGANTSIEMRFHTSWDWLMPVVDKIEQVHEGVPNQLINLSLFSTRQEIYQSVVEFINQLNKNN